MPTTVVKATKPTKQTTKETKTTKTKSGKTIIKSTTSASKNTTSTKSKKKGGAATQQSKLEQLQTKLKTESLHNNMEFFKTIRSNVIKDKINLKQALIESDYVNSDTGKLTTGVIPFNVFARQALGVMPNPVKNQNGLLGKYANKFMVCHNKPENDENAGDDTFKETASMATPDENGPGHVFITTKDLQWKRFNVISMDTNDIDFLKEMKEAGKHYANQRKWTKVGMYFHCFPYNSVQSLHLHVVNLANKGPALKYHAHKNLPIDSVIVVLENEKKQNETAKIYSAQQRITQPTNRITQPQWNGGKRARTKKNDKKTQKSKKL